MKTLPRARPNMTGNLHKYIPDRQIMCPFSKIVKSGIYHSTLVYNIPRVRLAVPWWCQSWRCYHTVSWSSGAWRQLPSSSRAFNPPPPHPTTPPLLG